MNIVKIYIGMLYNCPLINQQDKIPKFKKDS